MTTDPRVGTRLGPYQIEALVGTGGMGRVYRAVHEGLGTVALKMLDPSFTDNDEFRERFLSEARHARTISRSVPNIVHVYDAGELGGALYLAMDYMEGGDLRGLIDRSPGGLEPQLAFDLIRRVAEALDAAHAEGLVHRDVKPQNILLDGRGRPFLSDFGVAKELALKRTATGAFLGTVSYAAPEQIQGQDLDRRADVYSLGCVLYECLTGEPAYDKDSEVALMYAHLLEPPPRLTPARPDLPPELDTVIGKAMAKSRDDRYATTGALAEALGATLGTGAARAPETVLSRPQVTAESKTPPPPPPPPAAPPAPPPAPRPATAPTLAERKRSPWPLAIGIIVLAALLAGGAVLAVLLTRGEKKAASSTSQIISSTQVTTAPKPSGSAAFSKPPGLFSEKTTDKGSALFDGSSLVIESTKANSPVLDLASGNYDDVRIAVDVRGAAGANDYGASVICRHQTEGDYYLLAIASGSRYNVVRYTGGRPRSLVGGFQTSSAVKPSSQTNRLVVTCTGAASTQLTLEVNGTPVADVTNEPGIGDGEVGLRAGTVTPPVKVRFSRFRLTRLS
jgi:serine/threonine-protein kinase